MEQMEGNIGHRPRKFIQRIHQNLTKYIPCKYTGHLFDKVTKSYGRFGEITTHHCIKCEMKRQYPKGKFIYFQTRPEWLNEYIRTIGWFGK